VDHLGAVVDGNLDDLVASEVGADRSVLPALANDVRLIGLCVCLGQRVLLTAQSGGQNRRGWRILCLCIERRSS